MAQLNESKKIVNLKNLGASLILAVRAHETLTYGGTPLSLSELVDLFRPSAWSAGRVHSNRKGAASP